MAAVSRNCDGLYAGVLETARINTQHITTSSVHSTKPVAVECEYTLLLTRRYFHARRDLTVYFVKFF